MSVACLLDRIITPGGLSTVFQPMFRRMPSGWRLSSVEALVRGPADTHLRCAEVLFNYGRRKNAVASLDRACLRAIVPVAARLGRGLPLSVNVHGITLEKDAGFVPFLLDLLARNGMSASTVTLELVEHAAATGGAEFAAALETLRGAGVRIALDDIGLGQSNYRMIVETRPESFKIDRWLVAGCAVDRYRRAVLRSLADLAASFGGYAVAEGVENLDDLRVVLHEGITTVQGYLLARPASAAAVGSYERLRAAAARLPTDPDAAWAARSDWISAIAHELDHPVGAEPAIRIA